MSKQITYENSDATVWEVTEDDGSTHWETKVGIQKILRFDSEEDALAHVRRWEGEARHDRYHQDMASSRKRPGARR